MTLHIGAHKTASTYLQKTFLANADALEAQGCIALGPERLRRDLMIPSLDRPMRAIRRKTAPLRALMDEGRARGQRFILSNENIIGGPRPPVMAAGAQLYPGAPAQITALLEALELEQAHLCLALRDPLGLLVSAWGHQYLAGRPIAFDKFIAGVVPEALRWSELITRLQTCPRVGRITLWRFEAFHGQAQALVRALAGLHAQIALQDPPERAGWTYLVGPSQRALMSLPRVMRDHPDLSAKDALRRAMRRYPKSADHPGPQPFAPEAVHASQERYAQDWAMLQSMPKVTCLQP